MKINVLSLFVSTVMILAGSGNEGNKKETENSENKQKINRFSRFSNFKSKTNGTNLRKRRAATPTGAFSVGHQFFSRNFQLAESDVCSVHNNDLLGNIRNNSLLGNAAITFFCTQPFSN